MYSCQNSVWRNSKRSWRKLLYFIRLCVSIINNYLRICMQAVNLLLLLDQCRLCNCQRFHSGRLLQFRNTVVMLKTANNNEYQVVSYCHPPLTLYARLAYLISRFQKKNSSFSLWITTKCVRSLLPGGWGDNNTVVYTSTTEKLNSSWLQKSITNHKRLSTEFIKFRFILLWNILNTHNLVIYSVIYLIFYYPFQEIETLLTSEKFWGDGSTKLKKKDDQNITDKFWDDGLQNFKKKMMYTHIVISLWHFDLIRCYKYEKKLFQHIWNENVY